MKNQNKNGQSADNDLVDLWHWGGFSKEQIEHMDFYSAHYGETIDLAAKSLTKLRKNKLGDDEELPTEYIEQIKVIQDSILSAADALQEIQDFQRDHKIVEHRHEWTEKDFEEAHERGVVNFELDLNATKDGQFYVTYHDSPREYSKKEKRAGEAKRISELTADDVEKVENHRMSLARALEIHDPYKERGTRLVLQLKDFGQYDGKDSSAISNLRKQLEDAGMLDSVSISSLSPELLIKAHGKMPEVPLILNTGIFPAITHQEKGDGEKVNPVANTIITNLAKGIAKLGRMPRGNNGKWWTIGIKGLGHIVVCGPEGVSDFFHNAGNLKKSHYGHQFAMTDIPEDILGILRQQREDGKEYAGVSMGGNSMVDYFAKKIPFLRKWSENTITHYYKYLDEEKKVTPQIQIPGKHTVGIESKTKDKRFRAQAIHLLKDIKPREVNPIIYSGDPATLAKAAIDHMRGEKKKTTKNKLGSFVGRLKR